MTDNSLDIRTIIGRSKPLFVDDLEQTLPVLTEIVSRSRFLVIGGAGSIGQAVVKQLFALNPRALHVVDISENGLVELVRDLRSSLGYIDGDFRTFAVDFGTEEFRALFAAHGPYEFVANLAALKHVRSERDPYTLMRLTRVNVINTLASLQLARTAGAQKYFAVSSDKAANPYNMMGASKRIMEMFLAVADETTPVSTARFANVAFSNGSLLDGFRYRLRKRQPLAAPSDIQRYFVTEEEAGRLCLLSIVLGRHSDIFFPKAPEELQLVSFADIAERFLLKEGLRAHLCYSEDEARSFLTSSTAVSEWPVFVFETDTTGEKPFEEFYTSSEKVEWSRFQEIGVVKNEMSVNPSELDRFRQTVNELIDASIWDKKDLVLAYSRLVPSFQYEDTGRYLDGRM